MTISPAATITVACTLYCILASARSELFNCNGSTEYFELGSRVEVLCYNETSLYAVLWSREGSNEPFLRWEKAGKTVTAGYGITDEGAMIITDLQLEHEGLYLVAIVDRLTSTVVRRIRISATVMLRDEPHIEQCHTSSSDWCTHLSERERATFLVCIAEGSLSAASLSWGRLRGHSPVFTTNTSFNSTSSLFTAYATLQYDTENFAQELFTCNISGIPVEHTIQESIYLQGKKLIDGQTNTKNVTATGILDLECFTESVTDKRESLSRWRYISPDGTMKVLRNSFPENSSGPCYFRKSCVVNENGALRVTGVTYGDEGVYECVFTNSSSDGNTSTDVSVIVVPTPLRTVISGCDNPERCNMTVANGGMLMCSVFGSRPAIRLSIVIRESDQQVVSVYNQQYSVSDIEPDSGTFNSSLEVQYDIEECGGPVQLSCIAEDINGISIQSSMVNLITDLAKCDEEGRPGLIVPLVLLFFFMILGIPVCIKRKYVHRKLSPLPLWYMRSKPKSDQDSLGEEEHLKPKTSPKDASSSHPSSIEGDVTKESLLPQSSFQVDHDEAGTPSTAGSKDLYGGSQRLYPAMRESSGKSTVLGVMPSPPSPQET